MRSECVLRRSPHSATESCQALLRCTAVSSSKLPLCQLNGLDQQCLPTLTHTHTHTLSKRPQLDMQSFQLSDRHPRRLQGRLQSMTQNPPKHCSDRKVHRGQRPYTIKGGKHKPQGAKTCMHVCSAMTLKCASNPNVSHFYCKRCIFKATFLLRRKYIKAIHTKAQ